MDIVKWWSRPHVRRGLAMSAIVLSAGGLILHRAPASAKTPNMLLTQTDAHGEGSFQGPGAHGSVALAQTRVLAGQTQRVYAEIRLKADEEDHATRQPVSLAVVLDTSGSMQGEKIEQAKSAIIRLISDMHDDDEIAFIRYSDSLETVQSLSRLGDVRASLISRVRGLTADGGTMIAPALHAGLEALREARPNRVRRIVLASDGLDGTRKQSEAFASDAFEHGVNVSSLGIGLDFDESYMGGIATSGHGNFAFVNDGAVLATFFHKELVEASTTTIEGATVNVRVPDGMRFISATGADAVANGETVKLKLGSLFSGDERRVVCEFETNARVNESLALKSDVSWTRVKDKSVSTVSDVVVNVTGTSDARAVSDSTNGSVFASAASVVASKRELEAATEYARGNTGRAQTLIGQNLSDLDQAAMNAPAPMAAAIRRQATSYSATKEAFAAAAPASDVGKAAAKSAAAKDTGNMTRMSY